MTRIPSPSYNAVSDVPDSPLSELDSDDFASDRESASGRIAGNQARDHAATGSAGHASQTLPVRTLGTADAQETLKRTLTEEISLPAKRMKLGTSATGKQVDRLDLAACKEFVKEEVPEKFRMHFDRLLGSHYTSVDNWALPNHQRFMAAFCQSVHDALNDYCIVAEIDTIGVQHIDTLFQSALAALKKVSDTGGRNLPMNRFLRNEDHAAYVDMLDAPDTFFTRIEENQKIFEDTAAKLNQLVPRQNFRPEELWKLCIDPQVAEMLHQKHIDVDNPLIGPYILDGEKNYMHNMARALEFVADAALEGRPLSFRFIVELNAVIAGNSLEEAKKAVFMPEGSEFLLLDSFTLSKDGRQELEQRMAELRKRGLDISLTEVGKCEGSPHKLHELGISVENERDVQILEDWITDSIRNRQSQSENSHGDDLQLLDFELVARLNQAHVHPDRNIRSNAMLLNFLRLIRGEAPFMLPEPNVLDGFSKAEMLAKMHIALTGKVEVPARFQAHAKQKKLLEDLQPAADTAELRPIRNAPVRRKAVTRQEFIDGLPEGVWQKAQDIVMAGTHYSGVSYEKTGMRYIARMSINGRMTSLGNYYVNRDQDQDDARTQAVAAVMASEAIHGKVKARENNDDEIIAGFTEEIWKAAKATVAAKTHVSGVRWQAQENRFIAQARVDGEPTTLGSFSNIDGRGKDTARAMAIARLWTYQAEHETASREGNQKNRDQAIIDGFADGVWEEVQQKHKTEPLPDEIKLVAATKKTNAVCYTQVRLDGKTKKLGSFSINETRTQEMAETLALAKLVEHRRKHPKVTPAKKRDDKKARDDIPSHIMETASNWPADKRLPDSISHSAGKKQYQIREVLENGERKTLASFTGGKVRTEAEARTMAIATALHLEEIKKNRKSKEGTDDR